ncbi:MAG TPA: metallophosphoesterase [Woeseiaceae bacterium]|nr:metallophosphoesterase [Woeseiaceae bacterium]
MSHSKPIRILLALAATFIPLCGSGAAWHFTDVGRVVAISDVHGAYAAMVRTLKSAEVLDEALAWRAGATHLVITGDILDRGPDSRQVMDLLMRLEGEAEEAGGRVHLLLGNHEIMNLTGDLRYVSAAEYAAFTEEEIAADREQAFQVFRSLRPEAQDEEALRRDFGLRAPPGYFGHRSAFAPDGHYGKWLLEKPLLIVINDTAFVHGGLSPLVTDLGLDGVNDTMKNEVARYASALEVVIEAGLIDPTENFFRHAEILKALPADPQRPAEIAQAIADVIRLNTASVHDSQSPVWYRGNVGCGALVEDDKLDAALAALGAERVVIGHTPTQSRQVLQRLAGRVIEVDTGMLNAYYGGSGHALVIEGDALSVLGETGPESSAPVAHPRPAVPEVDALSAVELERILANGEIRSNTVDASGQTVVQLQDGETSVTASFVENSRKGFAPELAAYRLDRLLQLDMVPVTVVREIDGDMGTLQLLPATKQNEVTRSASGEGTSAWCPLPEQWNAMYVFDALTYNALRHPQSMLYNSGNWQLMLVGHAEAFGTRDGRPSWLDEAELKIGAAWVEALSSLTDEVLQAELGDVLDKRRLRALTKRRDALLEEATL